MGTFLNNQIARVDEPKQITLINNPNFITFSSQGNPAQNKLMKADIQLFHRIWLDDWKPDLVLAITDSVGKIHTFRGVYDSRRLSETNYLLEQPYEKEKGKNQLRTLYNLRDCLLRNSFIKNNFEVKIPLFGSSNKPVDKLELISKGYGDQYNVTINYRYEEYKPDSQNMLGEADIIIRINDIDYTSADIKKLNFLWSMSEKKGPRIVRVLEFEGSFEKNDDVYFKIEKPKEDDLSKWRAKYETLRNLKACLERNPDINSLAKITLNKENLELQCELTNKEGNLECTGIGSCGNLFKLFMKNGDVEVGKDICNVPQSRTEKYPYYDFIVKQTLSYSSDTIDEGNGRCEIALDIYTGTNLFLGQDIKLKDGIGNYLTTLSKSYFGKPLWFELNTLMSKRSSYSPLFLTELEKKSAGWINTGTVTDYYLVARRNDGSSTEPFYISDTLYGINGYDYTLNDVDLKKYILDLPQDFYADKYNKVHPLTECAQRTHIKGQKQYFNFLLRRADSEIDLSDFSIALQYKLFTQSGVFIDEHIDQAVKSAQFNISNTSLLHLDQFLPKYKAKTVGKIDVNLVLYRKSEPGGLKYPVVSLSETLSFRILPSLLHKVNDFAFLNHLGGWDSFNFGGTISKEFKTTSTIIYKTLQPGFNRQSELESIVRKTVQEHITVQTSPITSQVAEWLREISTSVAVYELSTQRYIIVDDMTLKYNNREDRYQVEMKYHYSDTYNGRIK